VGRFGADFGSAPRRGLAGALVDAEQSCCDRGSTECGARLVNQTKDGPSREQSCVTATSADPIRRIRSLAISGTVLMQKGCADLQERAMVRMGSCNSSTALAGQRWAGVVRCSGILRQLPADWGGRVANCSGIAKPRRMHALTTAL